MTSPLEPEYQLTNMMQPIAIDHHVAMRYSHSLQYWMVSFDGDISFVVMIIIVDHHHKMKGHFGTIAQYPMPPTERVYCSTLSQCPRRRV